MTLHVLVQNRAPAYTLPVPDPGVGYSTRYLDSLVGLFLPNRSRLRSSFLVDGKPERPVLHVPRVPSVHNRKFLEPSFSLNAGESWTTQVTYVVERAAEVGSDGTLVYRLDVDPQPLVTPETFDVTVHWPKGWHPTGDLPEAGRPPATAPAARDLSPRCSPSRSRCPAAEAAPPLDATVPRFQGTGAPILARRGG